MAVYPNPHIVKDPFGNRLTLTEGGQMRAYADSQWAGTVEITRPELNNEDMVRFLVEQQVREGHIFMPGVEKPFAAPSFTLLEQQSDDPSIWRFIVKRTYLD